MDALPAAVAWMAIIAAVLGVLANGAILVFGLGKLTQKATSHDTAISQVREEVSSLRSEINEGLRGAHARLDRHIEVRPAPSGASDGE